MINECLKVMRTKLRQEVNLETNSVESDSSALRPFYEPIRKRPPPKIAAKKPPMNSRLCPWYESRIEKPAYKYPKRITYRKKPVYSETVSPFPIDPWGDSLKRKKKSKKIDDIDRLPPETKDILLTNAERFMKITHEHVLKNVYFTRWLRSWYRSNFFKSSLEIPEKGEKGYDSVYITADGLKYRKRFYYPSNLKTELNESLDEDTPSDDLERRILYKAIKKQSYYDTRSISTNSELPSIEFSDSMSIGSRGENESISSIVDVHPKLDYSYISSFSSDPALTNTPRSPKTKKKISNVDEDAIVDIVVSNFDT